VILLIRHYSPLINSIHFGLNTTTRLLTGNQVDHPVTQDIENPINLRQDIFFLITEISV
jgi:hypothetical protein